MQTIKEYLPKIKRYLIIFSISLVALIMIGLVINAGLVSLPSGAIFVKNFDDLESVKSWNQFKQDNDRLDPENTLNRIPMNVYFNSLLDELLYPKSVTAIHVKIDMKSLSSKNTLQKPSFLVIILDQNERIRGKLYTRYESRDYTLKGTIAEYVFWFNFPTDIQGEKYSVIVELFGIHKYEESLRWGSGAVYSNEVNFMSDDTYGQLPSTGFDLSFLAYYRHETKIAPPSSIINPWSLAFQASALISTSIGVFLIRFWKELKNYHLQHPDLLLYESLCFLTLVLFVVFIFLIVALRI